MEKSNETLYKGVLELLKEYELLIENHMPEKDCDSILLNVDAMVPNSDFYEVMFYGEKDRNIDEVAREVSIREQLFQEHGSDAVKYRIINQINATLSDTNSSSLDKRNAKRKLGELGIG